MPKRVDYVVLYVENLSASIGFYRDVVGLDYKFDENGYAEFDAGQTKFGLYEKARLTALIGREGGPKGPTVANVFLVDDVDAEAKRLESLGISILAGPEDRPWGHRTVHIFDPDENIVEFAQEISRSAPRHSGE